VRPNGNAQSANSALLTEPSDHVNSATAAATEDAAITARVSDFSTRSQSGDVDRTQLSARFSAFLTQRNADFAKVALAPNGPAKLVYRGASSTPAGKTYFYGAHFATTATQFT
jgi:hypothetical protein